MSGAGDLDQLIDAIANKAAAVTGVTASYGAASSDQTGAVEMMPSSFDGDGPVVITFPEGPWTVTAGNVETGVYLLAVSFWIADADGGAAYRRLAPIEGLMKAAFRSDIDANQTAVIAVYEGGSMEPAIVNTRPWLVMRCLVRCVTKHYGGYAV